jgi:hypothetical protein
VTRFESDVRPTQAADISPPIARRCLAEIALALPDGRQREKRAIRGLSRWLDLTGDREQTGWLGRQW